MISVLTYCVVDREFKPRSGQIKAYKIGVSCFSGRTKKQEQRQEVDNESSDMCIVHDVLGL